MSEQVSYPITKEEYGSSLWKILHSYTANLPEKVSSNDRRNFKHTVLDLVDKYPCSDCKDHALSYLKAHKPKSNTRQDYFNFLCEFHNEVNQKTGKPTQDCSTLLTSVPCPTCSGSLKPNPLPEAQQQKSGGKEGKHQSRLDQLVDSRLNQAFGDYKNASVKIVEKMCSNAGEPVPEMTFSEQTPCSDPNTSCTHMPVDR